MKPWRDLAAIPMPTRILTLRKDARGYPIPFAVGNGTDGQPDFRVIEPAKWMRAAQHRLCGICGESMGAHLAFVGGTLSISNRLFTDLPMHRDCAVYALRACPFLAAPKFAYSRTAPEWAHVSQNVDAKRPNRFGLGVTKDYKLARLPDGEVVIQAAEFSAVEWWHEGEAVAGQRLEQLRMQEAREAYDVGALKVYPGPRAPDTRRGGVWRPGKHLHWYIGFHRQFNATEAGPVKCHELPTFPTATLAEAYLKAVQSPNPEGVCHGE